MRKSSAYIIAFNEEKHIGEAVKSLKFADEIIVVDAFSSDCTAEAAAEAGAKVIKHKFESFGKQRNFALAQCSYDWIICLDADERITSGLKNEIETLLQNQPDGDVFLAPRKSMFINKWILHSGWYPDYRHPVLFNKTKAGYKESLVHEDIDYKGEKKIF
jgi:glycosyltransferase involved in cell wall biosynthesis